MRGAPLAFGNIKLVKNRGRIFEDEPSIHLNIQADFVVFKPQVKILRLVRAASLDQSVI